jgi:hypothetical protein
LRSAASRGWWIGALLVVCAGCGSSDEVSRDSASGEQAVIVHLAGAVQTEAVFALEDRLIEAIEGAGAGEFDGNAIAVDEVILYAYGPDADALFEAMEPVLAELPPLPGSYALKRYGAADDPQAQEVRVEL